MSQPGSGLVQTLQILGVDALPWQVVGQLDAASGMACVQHKRQTGYGCTGCVASSGLASIFELMHATVLSCQLSCDGRQRLQLGRK
jgi:hypothetical protein